MPIELTSMLQWKASSMWKKKRECGILSGWDTSQALGQHSVSLLAMSVSWADILCVLKILGGSLTEQIYSKVHLHYPGKYADILKTFLAVVSMISISRDIFSRRPCWLNASKKFVYLQKRNKGTFVSVFCVQKIINQTLTSRVTWRNMILVLPFECKNNNII